MTKIVVIYWSGTGNTESMAEAIYKGAKELAEVELLLVSKASIEQVEAADAVALGCPAMGNEVLEEDEMEPFIQSLANVNWKGKQLALFGSYDWGEGEWMQDWEKRMTGYGATLIQEGLITRLEPEEDILEACRSLGKKLAQI